MVLGVQYLAERVGEGRGQPPLDSNGGEELMLVQPGVAIALGRHSPESPGTLFISTKRVMWLSDTDRAKGYAVGFLSISLHAVSRDPEAYPLPCIYCQIETEAAEDNESDNSDADCAADIDISQITEMRIVPSDSNQLDNLFDIFCHCAELNPEPMEGDEEENSWVFDDQGLVNDDEVANPIGFANGNDSLEHSVFQLHIDDQRFEDAKEVEDPNRSQS